MLVRVKIPKALERDLLAASAAVHLTPGEFVRECAEVILAQRRLMCLPPAPHGARLHGEHVSLTVKPTAEDESDVLDTLADALPTADDLDVIGDIS
jgi:hypothetical protein